MSEFEEFMIAMAALKKNSDFSIFDSIPDSELRPKAEISKMTGTFYKKLNEKVSNDCLVEGCQSAPIASHSVQRALLGRISSQDNHVLRIFVDIEFKRGGKIEPVVERIGLNKASTFDGFCSEHDTSIFAPIETKPLNIIDPEQNFLFNYRAICREYVTSRNGYFKLLSIVGEILPTLDEKNLLGPYLISELYITYCALHHVQEAFRVQRECLKQKLFQNEFVYLSREYSKALPVYASGFFPLQSSIYGKTYSRDITKGRPIQMSITIIPNGTGTNIYLAYLKNDESELSDFLKHFQSTNTQDFEVFISDVVLRNTENFFVSDVYWSSFDEKDDVLRLFWRTVNDRDFKIGKNVNLFKNVQ